MAATTGRLASKVAMITGAGKGIGRATAELFAHEGAVVIVAEVDEASGQATAAAITGKGGRAHYVKVDVTSEESVSAAFSQVNAAHGALHVLHNNAGGSSLRDGSITKIETAEFRRTLDLNLFGTWLCCRHGIPMIAASGGGSVINMSSIAALIGLQSVDAYAAAKGAVTALTRTLAVEFASSKVRVNAVAPTRTLTERVIEQSKSRNTGAGGGNLLGPAEPIDVARTVLYLASDDSRMMTGQILALDSGRTIT
jgi:NAD(P)-dependent dehydrogenase (short-subunit alcohol dehydrogenase family)